MLAYVTLGTNDIDRALSFYDQLLEMVGARRLLEVEDHGGFTLFGRSRSEAGLVITQPWDQQEASVGNGTMVALPTKTRGQVDAIYARALELGATDDGAPGLRSEEGPKAFYGAYFRDPDGHKICAVCIGPAEA